VLGQAAGFAVLAALSPPALLAVAAYLSSASPRKSLLIYLAGALTMTVVLGVVILLAIHAGGLNHPSQRQPRYGLRLGLGVVALGAGIFLARRGPRPRKPDKKPGLITRILAHPAPIAAFAVGMLLFTPSASFIAAVQVIATAKASDALIALALALVVVIDVSFIWLPLILYLAAPDATTRRLRAANAWIQARSHVIIVAVLVIVGLLLIGDGTAGLAG
jgi:type II secretory pathway component PulM